MNPSDKAHDEPWYRNPMVWLVIAIPAATIAGCMLTIFLALANPDFLVKDPIGPASATRAPASGDGS